MCTLLEEEKLKFFIIFSFSFLVFVIFSKKDWGKIDSVVYKWFFHLKKVYYKYIYKLSQETTSKGLSKNGDLLR